MLHDEVFIRKAFDQDPRSGFELLFRRYHQPLFSHACRLVYSPDIADDIVSDVFLAFWQREAYKNVTSSFRAYLFMSVRYAAFASLRKELAHEPLDSTDALNIANAHATADSLLSYDELYLRIDKAIQALPPKNQKVFILSRFEGMSHAEIARQLEITPKTVEMHIHKTLGILRSLIFSS